MAIRPIVRYPDPRLHRVAAPVTIFDAELHRLAGDLLDTMLAAPGIGITAPHIGVAKRVVVLRLSPEQDAGVYVNPSLVWASTERLSHKEGSVSMPGVSEEVERHARVRVAFQGLDGAARIEEAEGLLAVCHQHEIDQLDGIFWIARLSRLKRERMIKKYEKQMKSSLA